MTAVSDQGLLQQIQAVRLAIDEILNLLDSSPVTPFSGKDVAELRAAVGELRIRLEELDAEPATLTVVLMGGTGVGKSTLLNAIAGERIAQSGIVRPTTQFSTVYHHADLKLDLLPAPFRHCRNIAHHRDDLRHKVLIDTPDMDGSVVEHHERLREILPAADAVLYVGSGEKYHDLAGWKILREQARSRGFAFLLNKWDRCLASHDESTGTPPDEDFRRSLRDAGFESPLLFRVCGRQWEARRVDGKTDFEPIPDDFADLCRWLEAELDDRAIRDIKARGIAGELDHILSMLGRMTPPDWSRKAQSLRMQWEGALRTRLADHARLLVEAADSQSVELERHFGLIGRQGIGGIFGVYLRLFDRIMHLPGLLLPFSSATAKSEMQRIAERCLDAIPPTTRQTHRDALREHLLALADREGWPIEPLGACMTLDEYDETSSPLADGALSAALAAELVSLERDYTSPEGGRRVLQILVRFLCYWLPWVVLAGIGVSLIYSFSNWTMWGFGELFSSALLLAATIAGLHLLLVWAFPVNWEALRGRLFQRLENHLVGRLAPTYTQALERLAGKLSTERQRLSGAHGVLKGVRDHLRRMEGESASSLFSRFRVDHR